VHVYSYFRHCREQTRIDCPRSPRSWGSVYSLRLKRKMLRSSQLASVAPLHRPKGYPIASDTQQELLIHKAAPGPPHLDLLTSAHCLSLHILQRLPSYPSHFLAFLTINITNIFIPTITIKRYLLLSTTNKRDPSLLENRCKYQFKPPA
jgi:hypothetical protein